MAKTKSHLQTHELLENIEKARSRPQKPATIDKVLESASIASPKLKKSRKEKNKEDYESSVLSKKEQRKVKKSNRQRLDFIDDEAEEDEAVEEEQSEELDITRLAESESESDSEIENENENENENSDDNESAESEEEDIALSDIEVDSDSDVIPHTKLTINNTAALKESLARIALPWNKHSFAEHQSIISEEKTELGIKDIYDDTQRELAFYKQGLDAVKQGRSNLLKLKVPFSRPLDYFAEMVKSDEHMDKLKNKLLTEAADKKASEEAKRQRQLKKFGKQVQHETLQQRAKQKKESLEKVKGLRKRKANNEFGNDDEFQIALEEATAENNKRQKPNGKRLAKDSKYGFGGKKRFLRKNDAKSSNDLSSFSSKKMKQRPGKSKRSRRN